MIEEGKERETKTNKQKITQRYQREVEVVFGAHTVGSPGLTVCLVDCMRTEVLVPSKQLRGNSAETKGQRESWASGWASLSLQI